MKRVLLFICFATAGFRITVGNAANLGQLGSYIRNKGAALGLASILVENGAPVIDMEAFNQALARLAILEPKATEISDRVPGLDASPVENSPKLITSGAAEGALANLLSINGAGTKGKFLKLNADGTAEWSYMNDGAEDAAGADGTIESLAQTGVGNAVTKLSLDADGKILTVGKSGRFLTLPSGIIQKTDFNAAVQAAINKSVGALSAAGGVMTEPLTLSGDPTEANHAVNRKYAVAYFGDAGDAKILKPNTWAKNTIIDFGDGLYGARLTGGNYGKFFNGVIETILISGVSGWIVDSGGWFGIGGGKKAALPVYAEANRTVRLEISDYQIKLIVVSDVMKQGTDYDLWVLYQNESPGTVQNFQKTLLNPAVVSACTDSGGTWNNVSNSCVCGAGFAQIDNACQAKAFAIIFDRQGGAGGSDTAVATYMAAMPAITLPTREGYSFDGYYDAASGGSMYYDSTGEPARNYDKAADTTLYAQWLVDNANCVRIDVIDNNGDGDIKSSPSPIYLTPNGGYYSDAACTNIVRSMTTPTKPGHVFDFYTSKPDGKTEGLGDNSFGIVYIDSAGGFRINNIAHLPDRAIYAQYKRIMTISYDCGSGATGTPPESHEITAALTVRENTCSKTGSVFVGWEMLKAADNSPMFPETTFWPGNTHLISDTSHDLALRAKWDTQCATLTLDYNNGSGIKAEIPVPCALPLTISEWGYSYGGNTIDFGNWMNNANSTLFYGWYDTADQYGGTAYYGYDYEILPGRIFIKGKKFKAVKTDFDPKSADKTLYARRWAPEENCKTSGLDASDKTCVGYYRSSASAQEECVNLGDQNLMETDSFYEPGYDGGNETSNARCPWKFACPNGKQLDEETGKCVECLNNGATKWECDVDYVRERYTDWQWCAEGWEWSASEQKCVGKQHTVTFNIQKSDGVTKLINGGCSVQENHNGSWTEFRTLVRHMDSWPDQATVPIRDDGQIFIGYWDQATGGTQYYNAAGQATSSRPYYFNKKEDATLYARYEAYDANCVKIKVDDYYGNWDLSQQGTPNAIYWKPNPNGGVYGDSACTVKLDSMTDIPSHNNGSPKFRGYYGAPYNSQTLGCSSAYAYNSESDEWQFNLGGEVDIHSYLPFHAIFANWEY